MSQTHLNELTQSWVRTLRVHSPKTVDGYVHDAGKWFTTQCQLAGKVPVQDTGLVPAALSPSAWHRLQTSTSVFTVTDLTPAMCVDVIGELSVTLAKASVRRCVSSVSNFFNFLCLNGSLSANPLMHPGITRPKVGVTLPKAVPESHVRELLAVVGSPDPRRRKPWPARDVAAISLLLGCGLRASEVCGVRMGDIVRDEGNPWLRVRGKGSKERAIPLVPEVLVSITKYVATFEGKGVTLGVKDTLLRNDDGGVLTTRTLHRLVTSWFERAGIAPPEQATVHGMRHSFANMSVAYGAPLQDVQELLGHASLETTRIYLEVNKDSLQNTMSTHRSRNLLGEMD